MRRRRAGAFGWVLYMQRFFCISCAAFLIFALDTPSPIPEALMGLAYLTFDVYHLYLELA